MGILETPPVKDFEPLATNDKEIKNIVEWIEKENKMITKTDKELETAIKKIFSCVKSIYIYRENGSIIIHLENRYCSFDNLLGLSKLLETTNINIDADEKIADGCDTCGHGEKYERTISCGNIKFEFVPPKTYSKKETYVAPKLSKAQRKEYKKLAKDK